MIENIILQSFPHTTGVMQALIFNIVTNLKSQQFLSSIGSAKPEWTKSVKIFQKHFYS